MDLIKLVAMFATLSQGSSAADQARGRLPQPHSTPAYMVLGKYNGEILRCPLHNPINCELIYTISSPVLDVLVHGEHYYACLQKGGILKCHWYKKQPCAVFHRADEPVYSLVATGGYLYASLRKDVLRCELNVPQSCAIVHTFEDAVAGLYEHDKYVYAVSGADFFRCSKDVKDKCVRVATGDHVDMGVAVSGWGNSIITFSWNGHLRTLESVSNKILLRESYEGLYFDMAVFKGIVYVIDTFGNILMYKWDKLTKCTKIVHHNDTRSISFVYTTYSVQSSRSGVLCLQSSPDSVFVYGAEHRGLLEISVADGKLVDARGALVDTRQADMGYSGRAAIFAMGPGGRILVSHAHRSGLVHITSLFAGNPVAGAGEMHVDDGVIRRIVACSEYYLADVELNRQVVQELYSRGYTRAKDIQLEECAYTCDRD